MFTVIFSRWCVRLGTVIILFSALAYILDFLPIDMITLNHLIAQEDSPPYYKIVSIDAKTQDYRLALLILGVSLVVVGKLCAVKADQ